MIEFYSCKFFLNATAIYVYVTRNFKIKLMEWLICLKQKKFNFKYFRLKTACATDERVHVTNEVIAGMRIIKMYSWEKSFKEILTGLRK